MPQQLSLTSIVIFLNDKLSAFKLRFSEIQPRYTKNEEKINSKKINLFKLKEYILVHHL